jgi:DNA polymerase III delta prime subunit
MIVEKYQPTTESLLFHNQIVYEIKTWIKSLQTSKISDDLKHILFLYGPIGCGKSKTVEILFNSFNIYNIDPVDLRNSEKISSILDNLPGFFDSTILNIDSNNTKKYNIILVDNIELCDKSILSFAENIHSKKNVNIPIILLCNHPRYKELFIGYNNCKFVEFPNPSISDLIKLVTIINTQENLQLTDEQILTLIHLSKYDIRQIFSLLEGYQLSSSEFEEYLINCKEKNVDIDLINKLSYLFDLSKSYDIDYDYTLSTSDPLSISSSIFQNYSNVIGDFYKDTSFNNISDLTEQMSISNVMQQKMYDEQLWDLYDSYTMFSCVLPSYSIKKNTIDNRNNIDKNKTKDIYYDIQPFKDYSYNFINSYNDIRELAINDNITKKLQYKSPECSVFGYNDSDKLNSFAIASIFLDKVKLINNYYQNNKKSKNTSKKEKLDICDNMTDTYILNILDTITDNIYTYKLYEVDIDEIILNIEKYKNIDHLKTNINNINLRIFKRYINIFTIDESNKYLNSNVEAALKYSLLKNIINNATNIKMELKEQINNDVEHLIDDLSNVWNI